MFDNFKQLLDLQKKAKEMKKEIDLLKVEKEKLDGQIKVKLTGDLKITDLEIDSSLLKEENRELVVSNVKNAINEAQDEIKSMITKKMRGSLA